MSQKRFWPLKLQHDTPNLIAGDHLSRVVLSIDFFVSCAQLLNAALRFFCFITSQAKIYWFLLDFCFSFVLAMKAVLCVSLCIQYMRNLPFFYALLSTCCTFVQYMQTMPYAIHAVSSCISSCSDSSLFVHRITKR